MRKREYRKSYIILQCFVFVPHLFQCSLSISHLFYLDALTMQFSQLLLYLICNSFLVVFFRCCLRFFYRCCFYKIFHGISYFVFCFDKSFKCKALILIRHSTVIENLVRLHTADTSKQTNWWYSTDLCATKKIFFPIFAGNSSMCGYRNEGEIRRDR